MRPGRRASASRCWTGSSATTTRAEALAVTANPDPLRNGALVVVAGVAAVVFAAPGVLVLASFVGLVHFDMNMLFVALPALAAAVALAVVARGALGNLLLPRPVLHADSEGLIDRRIMAVPVPWSNVLRAVSIPGGLVLELREPISTLGMGSFVYEQPEPGIAHIGLRGLTRPAQDLARSLLELASAAGSETGEADGHEKLPRRRWSV